MGVRPLTASLITLAVLCGGRTEAAGAGHGHHRAAAHCACCPRCGEVCRPSVEKGLEDKTCWDAECETICIPRVRFPWEKSPQCGCETCPPAKCARAKRINILVQYGYKCPACEYTFEAPETRPCRQGCRSGCDACRQPVAASPSLAPPAASPAAPPAPVLPVEARRPQVRSVPVPPF